MSPWEEAIATVQGILTSLRFDLRKLERDIIVRVLENSNWKIRGDDGAAKRLGVKPTTLASRMKRMGIQRSG